MSLGRVKSEIRVSFACSTCKILGCRVDLSLETGNLLWSEDALINHMHAAQPLVNSQHPICLEGWTLWSRDKKVINPNRPHLCELIFGPVTISKWIRLERFPEMAPLHIDWEMSSKHAKKLKPGYQKYLTKHASHNCVVGAALVEWKFQDDDSCPRCGQPEDTNHVLRCTCSGASETWNKNCTELEEWMTAVDAHPLLQDALLHNIQQWR